MPKKPMQRAIQKKSLMDDPRHLMRWLKSQAIGGSPEEAAKAVAKSEGISLQTAKQSIREVEAFSAKYDKTQFDLATRKYLMDMMHTSQEYMTGLMGATELVEIPNPKTGKKEVVVMPDKTTRLEAQRVFKDIFVGSQPKTPMIENNVNQVNQVAQISQSETTEERMRRLRKQAEEFNTLPPVVAAVPKYLDEGDTEEADDDGEEEGDDD